MAAKFSVIIPTFNHANFLKLALCSLIKQTFTDWECVIIDNHSQDHTDHVVAEFRDPRLRLMKIYNNGVIAASRNLGLDSATGEWVAFLDADDVWYSTRLEKIAAAIAEDEQLDVISTDEWSVHLNTQQKSSLRYGPYCPNFYQALLKDGNRLSTSATAIRREFLERESLRFRENAEFITVEDYDLWMRVARAGAKFLFISSYEGEYTVHGSNSSANMQRHYMNLKSLLQDHVFNLQEFSKDRESVWRYVLARVCLSEALAYSQKGQLLRSAQLCAQAILCSPIGLIKHLRVRARRRSGIATS
jgi:glycosyltransferase involved in cell wall biosynthesis